MNPNLVAYVAGPFSSATRQGVEQNIARATRVGILVAALGVTPLTPHANTQHPEFEEVQDYPFWILATAALLRRSDVLVTVPGWEGSSGSRGEVDIAMLRGMPVFTSTGQLYDWLVRRDS